MDSHPTSNATIHFLKTDGTPLEGPLEWEPAFIELTVSSEEGDLDFWIQEKQHPVISRKLGGVIKTLVEWPRMNTGHFHLRLTSQNGTKELLAKTVTIASRKINSNSFAAMIDDLERLPAQIAIALQKTGSLIGVKLAIPEEDFLNQELLRIRLAILGIANEERKRIGLIHILSELQKSPHQTFAYKNEWVRREQARKPQHSQLPKAYARRNNQDISGKPSEVLDSQVQHTTNVYENRFLIFYYEQVHTRLSYLIRALKAAQKTEGVKEAEQLLKRLTQTREQTSFLNSLRPLTQLPSQQTMVLKQVSMYRAVWDGYRDFQLHAKVYTEECSLEAPLENLPRLYQSWGMLVVMETLLQLAGELGYQTIEQNLIRKRRSGMILSVFPGNSQVLHLQHQENGTIVRLYAERFYNPVSETGPRSMSYQQKPDISIEILRADDTLDLYLFDPKYKLISEKGTSPIVIDNLDDLQQHPVNPQAAKNAKPKKEDIDKMHTYRDAIIDDHGNRVVRYAATLYPGPTYMFSDELQALSAVPGNVAELRGNLRDVLLRALRIPEDDEKPASS